MVTSNINSLLHCDVMCKVRTHIITLSRRDERERNMDISALLVCSICHTSIKEQLEDTARYAGLLLAPAEGFGRGGGPFLAIFGVL